ncbi:hypothetical protein V2G26_000205 [Clonostachys chloroleuca]
MHHLTFLFAAGLISTISAAPLPAANDALLDFQARSGYADDDTLARISRSLDALDQELEERGLFSKDPKPFNPDKTPNKLKKAEPVPKVPNKQPKTSNTLKKEKKGPKPNPATNFRRGFGKEPKPFNPEKTPNKLKKAEPVPKVPNKQPKTTNTLTKEKKHKTNPATNFRRGFGKEPKPFNPDKTPNKLKKAEPVPKVPNKQPKTSNTLTKEKKHKTNPATNFRRGFGKEPKPFNPDKTPNKLKKAEPVPKVPNKQPKTTNTLTKEKKHKTNPATNFRRYELELEERDEDFLEERDYEFLDERDDEYLDERDEEFLDERDEEFLEERDEDFLEERDDDFLEERDDEFLDERDEDFIEERGLFDKNPKPFNPDKTPNKLKKTEPVPKVPNKQPKTTNTLTKEKKHKTNPATNF